MTESTKTPASPKRRFAFWQGAAALSTLALVPLATGAMGVIGLLGAAAFARWVPRFVPRQR